MLNVVNIVTLLGWIIIGIAHKVISWQFSLLIIGRLLTGLSTGLVSASPCVYMAEIASTKLRGIFTTSSGAFFSLGVLFIYILGFILKVIHKIISRNKNNYTINKFSGRLGHGCVYNSCVTIILFDFNRNIPARISRVANIEK